MAPLTDEEKLDAIVGAALKQLFASGATSMEVGGFAARYRAEVAGILGFAPQKEEAPDLLAIVTQAVEQAMNNRPSGSVSETSARRPYQRKNPVPLVEKKRINIEINGRRTSLNIPVDVLAKMDSFAGSRREAVLLAQELAKNAPADVENRSAWVIDRAMALAHQPDQANPSQH